VAKLDPLGEHLWSARFGDGEWQFVRSIAVASNGDVIIAGPFLGSVDFGNGPMANDGSSSDIYVARLSGVDGTAIWGRRFAASFGNDIDLMLTLDSSDNIYIGGGFEESMTLGADTLVAQGWDAFIAKLDENGNPIWTRRFGDVEMQHVHGLAIDTTDNVYAVGRFSGTVSFGGPELSAPAGNDAIFFLLTMTPGGQHVWSGNYGSPPTGPLTASRGRYFAFRAPGPRPVSTGSALMRRRSRTRLFA
jgi:hypothetical protein